MSQESPGAQLILEILDTDTVAAEEKFLTLLRDLRRFLEWKGAQDPDGCVSEAIVRALERPERLVGMTADQLRGFLFGIARNVRREGHRRQSRERPLEPDGWAGWAATLSVEDETLNRLTVDQVRRCLDGREWELLSAYVDRVDHDALCRELCVTKGTLRGRIFRIRRKVRECLRWRRDS